MKRQNSNEQTFKNKQNAVLDVRGEYYHARNTTPMQQQMSVINEILPISLAHAEISKAVDLETQTQTETKLNGIAASQTQLRRKRKKKAITTRTVFAKDWCKDEAAQALALENEYLQNANKCTELLLKFPDPEINRDMVNSYAPEIEMVHFQQSVAQRFCFVQLRQGSNVPALIERISKIPFGNGFISAELRTTTAALAVQQTKLEELDARTLYIGNLAKSVNVQEFKAYFPDAQRIDIGFGFRTRQTRYAIVRFHSFALAMESFKRTVNLVLDERSLNVRFLRQNGSVVSHAQTTTKIVDFVDADSAEDENRIFPAAVEAQVAQTQLLPLPTAASVNAQIKDESSEIDDDHDEVADNNLLGMHHAGPEIKFEVEILSKQKGCENASKRVILSDTDWETDDDDNVPILHTSNSNIVELSTSAAAQTAFVKQLYAQAHRDLTPATSADVMHNIFQKLNSSESDEDNLFLD